MANFKDLLGKEMLFFDGATGTQLQARGLKPGEVPESWNLLYPERVKEVQENYFKAGANIVKTNTFGGNPIKLKASGLDCQQVIAAAVKIAREAAGDADKRFVALDLGPTGKLLQPLGDLPFEDCVAGYGEMVRYGAAAGADLILIETMSDTYELKAAILAAKENCELPICVSMTFDASGKLLTGGTVAAAACMCEALGVDAIGFNCGLGPAQLTELLKEMKAATSLPIIINPNAGLPVERDGKTVFEVGPAQYAELMAELAQQGVAIAGGCCGTTPEHIAATAAALKAMQPAPKGQLQRTLVSSYGQVVELGREPVLVGESLNPSNQPRLQEALRNKDMDYICRLALEQVEAGAKILDVNVSADPQVNEVEMLPKVIVAIQSVCDVPLAIDSMNPEALEAALRIYNGKPLLNSVGGDEYSLGTLLPLAKKYGAAIIGLCFDEQGIGAAAKERAAVAERIISRAIEAGLPAADVVIDPVALPLRSAPKGALVTCEALRMLADKNIPTIIGISNLSFKEQDREKLNSSFLAMALRSGLSCPICNVRSAAIQDVYFGYRALMGLDAGCKEYVARYGAAAKLQTGLQSSELSLYDAVVKGLAGEAGKVTQKLLIKEQPLDIINQQLIPALDYVGAGFEKKTFFLPQLLMSADAAKAAFEVIKSALGASQRTQQGETVIIATVKGDVHDIGKNIVKVLLENYGYRVLDLGKDVPVETIVKAVQETQAQVVGLSALMTTTVGAMEETIKAIRAQHLDAKVMVGGAVLTQEYADSIGAEHYAASAVSAVNYVNKFFNK